MSENNNTDLNEVFEEEMDDYTVITVPIDETLSNSGEAADAAAVGAALAQKADKDELPATIKVNGQQADNQGLILINGTHIQVSGTNQKTLARAVEEATEMTAETLPMSSDQGAETVAQKISDMAEDITELQQAGERTAENIPMETGSTTTIKNAIETLDRKAVKSVNRKLPDAAGDVDLSVVPLAENLQSDKLQSIEGEFTIRTTGGTGSVSDGKAYPQHIYGNSRHDGYVAEELNLTVIPITRTEPDEPITATIDRDTFVAAVDESSTINLYYTTEWSEDPEDYGVTVTGEPVAGDQITIVYVKEQRGTILVADPDRMVGTGWNLFNANDGYARVVKYSDVYGYKIGGTYTSIAFSATLTGDRTSLLPNANGLFNVSSDGYVFVTGGNATDTYILATWSDWTEGPSTGYWEAYRESGIDLSAVVETYFPYGMLKIGTVRDEIDLIAKRSISRIERMVYSEENRAAATETGRDYDFDESNIYIVREEYVQNAITIGADYSVSEHGLEWFTETELPLDTEILYGKNLRDKLERDVLTISPQNLVAEEQAQVRRNIGVMDPPLNGNGTPAQLLKTNGDGTTEWTTQGTPTDAQVGTAVSAWLTAHPEATTTVQDGAISRAKLNDDLKAKTDAVPDLKSAITQEHNIDSSGFIVDSARLYPKFVNGVIYDANPSTIVAVNNRVVMPEIMLVDAFDELKITASSGWEFDLWVYASSAADSRLKYSNWKSSYTELLTKKYIRITGRKNDNSDITPAQFLKNVAIEVKRHSVPMDLDRTSWFNSIKKFDASALTYSGWIDDNGMFNILNGVATTLYRAVPGDKISYEIITESAKNAFVVYSKDGTVTHNTRGAGTTTKRTEEYTFQSGDCWFVFSSYTTEAATSVFNAIYTSNRAIHTFTENQEKILLTRTDYTGIFQIGALNGSSKTWVNSLYGIVSRPTEGIKLDIGDKVYLTDYTGVHVRLLYLEDGQTSKEITSWFTLGKYTITKKGVYWIEVETTPSVSITNMDNYTKLVRIIKYDDFYDVILKNNVKNQKTDWFVKSINHRGMNLLAPENTLPAFILSARLGWKYVETDIAKTSDGVLVLLHDSTINRTARNEDGTAISGTVNIADITYEQALDYDFGIWKGTQYAGTKIPTLDEFLKLCRKISLSPYLDFGSITDNSIIDAVVATVKKNGMVKNTTIIAGTVSALERVKTKCDYMRIGLIASPTSSAIEALQELKTGKNEVFIDAQTGTYSTDAIIQSLIDADIPLETYTPNTETEILELNPYVTGVTSDYLVSGDILYDSVMEN